MPVLSQVGLRVRIQGTSVVCPGLDLHNKSCDWSQMGLLLQCVTDVVSAPISL